MDKFTLDLSWLVKIPFYCWLLYHFRGTDSFWIIVFILVSFTSCKITFRKVP